MLYFSSPNGLQVLIPHRNHRTILRDTSTDMIVPLSEAFVSLEIDGQPLHEAQPARTQIESNGLLLAMETAFKSDAAVTPDAAFLESAPVNPGLNALVHLSGGTLAAFPSEAFPDLADTPIQIKFGPAFTLAPTKITDTTVYKAALPVGRKCELVVVSPRRTVRLDISGGARFEVRNEDQKFGAPTDTKQNSSDEFQELLRFFGLGVKIECDYFQCLCAMCGEQ